MTDTSKPAVVLLSTTDGEPDADATEAAARALASAISVARDGHVMAVSRRPDGQVVVSSRSDYTAAREPLTLRSVHYGSAQAWADGQPVTDPPDAEEWAAADLSEPDALQLREAAEAVPASPDAAGIGAPPAATLGDRPELLWTAAREAGS
jgi:hypothetical protein